MGSGKTTFAKSFIREFCDDESISVISPTFTIIQTYTNANVKDFAYGEIWHIDLYRIKSFAEVTELGLEEVLFRNICIIEWPEQIEYLRVPNKISVYLNIMSASTRALSIRYK
jgi:tRNA threonylcarbamoyl adenosine modification protein YjeE